MNASTILSTVQVDRFQREGFLLIPGFYDVKNEIEPIQHGLYEIIGLLIQKYQLPILQAPFSPSSFDASYQALIAHDRKLGGAIYDAAKLIPSFIRLLASPKNETMFKALRGTDLAGIGGGSFGIRVDNPHEEQYRSHWHQEFLSQPQSLDGIVFWSSLVEITPEMGPVQICVGSHRDGLCRYQRGARYADKTGAYQIGLAEEEKTIQQYPIIAPLAHPGDLLILDYLTLHQSGFNVSDRSRWSMQLRYFNFREPTGIQFGWPSSVTVGTNVEALFPDHFVS